MTAIRYPWRWLEDAMGTTFAVRYPWIDAVQRSARTAERVCILMPEVVGPLSDWGEWLAERIDPDGRVGCLTTTGDFGEVTQRLADAYQVEEAFSHGRPIDWARTFLAASRRQMPHFETVPVVVVGADDYCAAGLDSLVDAQRALGYAFARPLLLRRNLPPDWSGEVIRFGLAEPVGGLHRIEPPPEQGMAFWTDLFVALTVIWETGGVPHLADELWEQLRLGRVLSLRDAGFDAWLDRQLDEFAQAIPAKMEPSLPAALAFGPLTTVDDSLWQSGSVAWQDGRFDVTPLRARRWKNDLLADAWEAIRRRRLTNVPLARWLSAWATSIEESLRVAVLRTSSSDFRRHLRGLPSRNHTNGKTGSRWEELDAPDDVTAVDFADFSDLTTFTAQSMSRSKRTLPFAVSLDRCRMARNRVVHERRLSAKDLLHILSVVDWLSENGLI